MIVFKKYLRLAIVAISVLSITLLPVNVMALENQPATTSSQTSTKQEAAKQTRAKTEVTATESKSTLSSASSCQSVNKLAATIQTQLTEKKAKVDSKRIDIYVKSTARRESRDSELLTKREEWDAKRQQNFDKLRSMAKTDEQKQAVEVYVSAITEAIKARRAANDAAFATFRSDLESFKKTAGQSTDVNISATTASINQAVIAAKAACASGQSADTVRQNLKTSIEAARQQSKTSRESMTKGEQIKAIAQKRNDAIKANDETFKNTTAAARDQLKAAFKESTN